MGCGCRRDPEGVNKILPEIFNAISSEKVKFQHSYAFLCNGEKYTIQRGSWISSQAVD